ncbi:MAG: hypothetical protein GKS02_12035 [Alphaproteobacteria bacterium]|nr:hypothetical protein [Alphaproteobacteria bacterium]
MNYTPETAQNRGGAEDLGEVLFEFSAVGNSVKVCAVDTDSLVEATIIGPVSAGEQALKHAALQKLRYVLAKKRSEAAAVSQTNRLFA